MGGFAGKERRKRSATAVVTKLVKAGILTKEEAPAIRKRIASSGRLGALKDVMKYSKPKGARRKAYVIQAPQAPKPKAPPKRSQNTSYKRKKS